MTDAQQKFGEWSPEEPANGEVKKICIDAGKQAGVQFDVCIPEIFRVLALCGGTNYLVKVKVGVDKFLHVMIHRQSGVRVPKESDITVTGVQYPKLKSDRLVPF